MESLGPGNKRRKPAMKRDTFNGGRPRWVDDAVKRDDLASLRAAQEASVESRKRNKKSAERVAADADEAQAYYREQEIAKRDAEASANAEADREHIVPLEHDNG